MTVSKHDLLDAMENSLFTFPDVPGKSENLSVESMKAVWSPATPSPMFNSIGSVRLNAENVDTMIRQVHEFYSSRYRAYRWFFVPSLATPENLGERLVAAGVSKLGEAAGLYTTNFDLDVKINPAITVREVMYDDDRDLVEVMARGFAMAEADIVDIMIPMFQLVSGRCYVAYLDGEAASAAVMFYMPRSPVAVFQGAATLPEFRGRGAYSALLRRRLQDAEADGMEAAVLQADRSTSAPICARYGFKELCGIEFYVWLPGNEARP